MNSGLIETNVSSDEIAQTDICRTNFTHRPPVKYVFLDLRPEKEHVGWKTILSKFRPGAAILIFVRLPVNHCGTFFPHTFVYDRSVWKNFSTHIFLRQKCVEKFFHTLFQKLRQTTSKTNFDLFLSPDGLTYWYKYLYFSKYQKNWYLSVWKNFSTHPRR